MAVTGKDLIELTHAIQQDIRAAATKFVELRAMIASLNLPEPELLRCPICGVQVATVQILAEHADHVHAADEPEHWEEP